jgi:hypothetical protein
MNEEMNRLLGKLSKDSEAAAEALPEQEGMMLRIRVHAEEPGKEPTDVALNLPLVAARMMGMMLPMMMPAQAREAMASEGISLDARSFAARIAELSETGGDIINTTHGEDGETVSVRIYIE